MVMLMGTHSWVVSSVPKYGWNTFSETGCGRLVFFSKDGCSISHPNSVLKCNLDTSPGRGRVYFSTSLNLGGFCDCSDHRAGQKVIPYQFYVQPLTGQALPASRLLEDSLSIRRPTTLTPPHCEKPKSVWDVTGKKTEANMIWWTGLTMRMGFPI